MHNIISWEQCQKVFDFDGSWRDIYVLNTNAIHWNKLLNSLQDSKYETKFWIDGEIAQPITTIQQALEIRSRANPVMLAETSGIGIACHFFTDKEIEFDIDPRQVNSQKDLDEILDFMNFLGNTLDKKVILTLENNLNIIILELNPKTQNIVYYDVEYP